MIREQRHGEEKKGKKRILDRGNVVLKRKVTGELFKGSGRS